MDWTRPDQTRSDLTHTRPDQTRPDQTTPHHTTPHHTTPHHTTPHHTTPHHTTPHHPFRHTGLLICSPVYYSDSRYKMNEILSIKYKLLHLLAMLPFAPLTFKLATCVILILCGS